MFGGGLEGQLGVGRVPWGRVGLKELGGIGVNRLNEITSKLPLLDHCWLSARGVTLGTCVNPRPILRIMMNSKSFFFYFQYCYTFLF